MNARKYLFGLLLLSGLPLWAGPGPERAPAWLDSKSGGEAPVWVSAEAAVDSETVLNWKLLRDEALKATIRSQRQDLQKRGKPVDEAGGLRLRSIAEEECQWGVVYSHLGKGSQPSGSFDDLLRYSRAIVRGTVRSVEPGFFYGKLAGSLLRVEVEEMLRDAHEYASPSFLYVYHSSAHFTVGPYQFCGDSSGHEAKAGDRILVFDYDGPRDRGRSLVIPQDSQVFFETPEAELFLPRRMSQDPELRSVNGLDELAEIVRRTPYSGQPEKADPNLIL